VIYRLCIVVTSACFLAASPALTGMAAGYQGRVGANVMITTSISPLPIITDRIRHQLITGSILSPLIYQ